jgi:hypothetical protein
VNEFEPEVVESGVLMGWSPSMRREEQEDEIVAIGSDGDRAVTEHALPGESESEHVTVESGYVGARARVSAIPSETRSPCG